MLDPAHTKNALKLYIGKTTARYYLKKKLRK